MSLFRKILGDNAEPQRAVEPASEINTDGSFYFFICFISFLDGDLYATLKRSSVLHEARCFNEKQINPRQCRKLLARLIYLINQV